MLKKEGMGNYKHFWEIWFKTQVELRSKAENWYNYSWYHMLVFFLTTNPFGLTKIEKL